MLELVLNILVSGCIVNVVSLYFYYEWKEVFKIFIMVIDEEENISF